MCRTFLPMVFAATVLVVGGLVGAAEYDPLVAADGDSRGLEERTHELVVKDEKRDRELPILVRLPSAADTKSEPAAVVLFSHGLGGSRTGCKYLAEHWTARGYVTVFLQHPGSDDSVWKDAPLLQRMAAMRRAASSRNWFLRVQDVPAVLDQLTTWNRTKGHVLEGRLDLDRIGMSGHSFGAVTTQAVSGQSFAGIGARYTDGRIKSAVAFSPSRPPRGDVGRAFGSVKVPWLLMTGTDDTSPIGSQTAETRTEVFPNLPPSRKYEVVLHEAEHSAFSDRGLPGDQRARNPNHHRAILAITTAFWDATLRGDKEAAEWLDGDGPQDVLEKEDRWRTK